LLKQSCLRKWTSAIRRNKYFDEDNHRKRKRCSLKDDNPNLQTPIQVKFFLKKCVPRKMCRHDSVQFKGGVEKHLIVE